MATRVVKSLHKRGSVSRKKVKDAAKSLAKSRSGRSDRAGVLTKRSTASGKKQIAFKRPSSHAFWG